MSNISADLKNLKQTFESCQAVYRPMKSRLDYSSQQFIDSQLDSWKKTIAECEAQFKNLSGLSEGAGKAAALDVQRNTVILPAIAKLKDLEANWKRIAAKHGF